MPAEYIDISVWCKDFFLNYTPIYPKYMKNITAALMVFFASSVSASEQAEISFEEIVQIMQSSDRKAFVYKQAVIAEVFQYASQTCLVSVKVHGAEGIKKEPCKKYRENLENLQDQMTIFVLANAYSNHLDGSANVGLDSREEKVLRNAHESIHNSKVISGLL